MKIISNLILAATISYAGQYESHCLNNFKDIELTVCLKEIEDKSEKIIQQKIDEILDSTGYYSNLSITHFRKSMETFDVYMKQQCEVLLILPNEVATKTTVQDCRIQMMINRIQELDYIFSEY